VKKSELLIYFEEKFDYLPKREVERTLEKILSFLSSSISKGNRIEIRGFGSFSIRSRSSRNGRNPSTGEKIFIDEKNFINFTPSKKLKRIINEK
tara:strand:+ start:522 stop:803 length:282 start_codon:yes stop_codon:yes gene_type:complete